MIFRVMLNKYISPVFTLFVFFGSIEAGARDIDWKKCQQPKYYDATIPFDKDNKFVPDCAPEVLYSWRRPEYIASYLADTKGGIVEKNGGPIFTFKTPAGSHGYGEKSVRIKLRKDVKFIFANVECGVRIDKFSCPQRDCKYYKSKYPKQYDKIVLVAHLTWLEGFSEYILCSDGAIESWSMGTPEHLEEIQNEYKYWKDNKGVKAHDAVGVFDGMINEKGRCIDTSDCSEKKLNDSIAKHQEMAKTGGKIFYSPGVAEDRDSHFNTDKKFYYSIPNTNASKNPERVNEDLYGGAK